LIKNEKDYLNKNKIEELDNPGYKSTNVYENMSSSKNKINSDINRHSCYENSNNKVFSEANFNKVEEAEIYDNPYASIQFNKLPNMYSSGSNVQSTTIKRTNNFDFNNFSQNNSNNTNQSNNFNFCAFNNENNNQPILQHSNTMIQKDSNTNKSLLDYPDFNNLNQASNNINTGMNFYQQNKETIHQGYNYYQSNQQQINQGINQGMNYYQKNQQTVDNLSRSAMNNSNKVNQSKDKNYDVFQDFFK
jgi:hypothetical protein